MDFSNKTYRDLAFDLEFARTMVGAAGGGGGGGRFGYMFLTFLDYLLYYGYNTGSTNSAWKGGLGVLP